MTRYGHIDLGTSQATAGVRTDNALAIAERSFHLQATGPQPLALDGRTIGHGLPARLVDLTEVRALLLGQTASDELKDATWRALVLRARTGDPAWVVGCVGVAMPGLKNTAAKVLRSSPDRYADDIVSELLTEFVAQLACIEIERPHIVQRLILWARKGALRARGREARYVPCEPALLPDSPADVGVDIEANVDVAALMVDAVRQGIIAPEEAELITSTRLEGLPVLDVARRRRLPANRLYWRRQIAEGRLAAAVRDGRLSVDFVAPSFGM